MELAPVAGSSAVTLFATEMGEAVVPAERLLPSGRSVSIKLVGQNEEIEVRSLTGDVEVRITLTPAGPVVSLHGARLELNAPETVAINCRRFEVATSEATSLSSAGPIELNAHEVKVQTTEDVHLDGKFIRLNCPKE